jgi:hypothetical protein
LGPSYRAAAAPAAVAGYPILSLPVGVRPDGKPSGVWMYAGFLDEPKLIALAYDLEQEMRARSQPRFRDSVPPEPRDAGICDGRGAESEKAGAPMLQL